MSLKYTALYTACYTVSLRDVSSMTIKWSVFLGKGSTPLFSERPQREKIRQRELELDLKEKKQSLYQSEEKVGHMLGNQGHCSIYKRYFWITGPK